MSDLKISKDTFYAHFKPLKACGYIKVEQTRIEGRHSHNVYTLIENVPVNKENENKPFSPCPKIPDTVSDKDADYENKPFLPCPKIPDTVLSDTVKPDTNNNSFKNNRSKSNTFIKHPPYPPQARGVCAENENDCSVSTNGGNADIPKSKGIQNQSSENLKLKTGGGGGKQPSDHSTTLIDKRFNEFWSAYPRKVGKSAVYKVWKRLNPNAELFARILTAIGRAAATEQWQRESGRFIPYPLTWLNQGRWDDDHSPVISQSPRPMNQRGGNALTRLIERMESEETVTENEVWGGGDL